MNLRHVIVCAQLSLFGFLGSALPTSPATAQVSNPAPSDPSLFDNVINVPTDPDIDSFQSVGGDGFTTQLNLFDGGTIGSFFDADSGSEVNINGGLVESFLDANSGSVVNIFGGTLSAVDANAGSAVNISGGSLLSLNADTGSAVNVTGGDLGAFVEAEAGSAVNISGGSVGNFVANPGSAVELIGGEFRLNGTAFSAPTITLSPDDVFTGTLSDGSTFIFSNTRSSFVSGGDALSDVELTSATLPTLDLAPVVVSAANPIRPSGLRAGQTLTLQNGGDLGPRFNANDATLNIEGGSIGAGSSVTGSLVNISGGSIGEDFNAFDSVVNISGGDVGIFFDAEAGSVVNITGGTFGGNFDANADSVVNISGGAFPSTFNARVAGQVNISDGSFTSFVEIQNGSVANISGGSFEDARVDFGFGSTANISGGTFSDFDVFFDTDINLIGSGFVLNGQELDSLLSINVAFLIQDRDVTLSGLFADGTAFSFDLNSNSSFGDTFADADFFSPNARLSVTLVPAAIPEPSSLTLLGLAGLILMVRQRKTIC